jgi:AraC-like DNA-binding protein
MQGPNSQKFAQNTSIPCGLHLDFACEGCTTDSNSVRSHPDRLDSGKKIKTTLLDAILHISIAQFIFAGLLALTRSKRQMSDYILACWFGLMTIFMVLSLLKTKMPDSIWAQLQLFPFFFALGPFLFLYVRALTQQKPKLEFADGLHLVPFIVFSVSALTNAANVDEDMLTGHAFDLNRITYAIACLVSAAVYIPLTVGKLRQHRENLMEFFSYDSDRISLGWLRMVVVGFTVMLLLTFLSALTNVFTGETTIHPGIFLFLGFAVFAFAFTFFGIRQPVIFSRRPDERFVDDMEDVPMLDSEAETESEQTERYAHSSLTKENAQLYLQQLTDYLGNGQPFLHRDLTLQDVAQELRIPQHHLTQTINELLNKNFYTLINEYRIEEVKRRLLDPKFAHYNILAIAHDAGFNSKSSFNMIFKKHVGVTPSQWRKEA